MKILQDRTLLPTGGYRCLTMAEDPEQAMANARPREHRFIPLDGRPFGLEIRSVALGWLLLRSERTMGAVAASAAPAPGTRAVFGYLSGRGPLRFLGREFDSNGLGVTHWDSAWQGVIPAGGEIISASFQMSSLRRICAELGYPDPEDALHGAWFLPRADSQRFLMATKRIINKNQSSTGVFRCDLVDSSAEGELLEMVLAAIFGQSTVLALRPTAASRRRVLRNAIEFIAENLQSSPRLVDVCRAAQATERTLQYAFKEAYGLSVGQFMKRARLVQARTELLKAAPCAPSILDVAVHWGFCDAGHFAVEYRRLFGERPSQTVRVKRSAFRTASRRSRTLSDS